MASKDHAEEAAVRDFLLAKGQELRSRDQVTLNRRVSTAAARDELFFREFERLAARLFRGKLQASGYAKAAKSTKTSYIVNALLSDLHYHSLLDSREVPHAYGPLEEARRTSAVALQVADYKPQHRDKTTLHVHLMGDIIQNQLHDPRDGATLTEQVCAAIHLLGRLLQFWARWFPAVVVFCTPGNHGRHLKRHPERAVHQKWDSQETIIYFALKEACSSLKNVTFQIPRTPYYVAPMLGKAGFFTHGDTVLEPGYPNGAIDVRRVTTQINEWRSSGEIPPKTDLFVCGHVHTGAIIHLPNGAVLMTNGCMIPTDGYGLSKGHASVSCGQWVFESTAEYVVGDGRFINLNSTIDKDDSLDRVIPPFLGFGGDKG